MGFTFDWLSSARLASRGSIWICFSFLFFCGRKYSSRCLFSLRNSCCFCCDTARLLRWWGNWQVSMGVSPSGTNVTPVVLSPKKEEEEEEEVSGGPLRAAPYSCRNQFEVVCSRPKERKKKNRSCRCPAALKMSADFLSNICVSLIFAFPRI